MRKEVSQGLGLVVIAVLLALVWALSDVRLVGAAAFLTAAGGLVVLAVGLLRPAS
jgi:hypothetical protein